MERFVDVGTATLAVTDVGKGLPVVLLHAGVDLTTVSSRTNTMRS